MDVIGIQRFAASFPSKMLRNRPAFHSKEKSRDYSVYSYSRIGSIERALNVAMWSNTSDTFQMNYSMVRAVTACIRQRAVDRLLGEPRYQSFSTTVKSFPLPGWRHRHIMKTQNTLSLLSPSLPWVPGGWLGVESQ